MELDDVSTANRGSRNCFRCTGPVVDTVVDAESGPVDNHARIGWWLYIFLLAGVAAYLAYSFVGLLVLGVFGYYATRPICQRLALRIDSDSIAAGLTVLLVLLPIVLLALYVGAGLVHQAQQILGGQVDLGMLPESQRQTLVSAIEDPQQFVTDPNRTLQTVLGAGIAALSALVGTLMFVGLAVTLSFFFLKNDDALSDGLRQLFGGADSTAYAYAAAVDADLESVFFGNLLFVAVMSVIAAVAYWVTNLLAPSPLQVPMVFVLAFLTGIASLVPVVVGKIVYLPVVGYLAVQAIQSGGSHLVFVGATLVAYFFILDILPQTFLQPYITGRQLDMIVMMFAYLLGPILFGWYGFFLMPIVFIVMLEAIRIVLPELVHGDPLTPTASMGESIGATPETAAGEASPDGDDPPTDDETVSDRG